MTDAPTYAQGTIAIAANSTAVTGTNTGWNDSLVGGFLSVAGLPGVVGIVLRVNSATSLTLADPIRTTAVSSGTAYKITLPDQSLDTRAMHRNALAIRLQNEAVFGPDGLSLKIPIITGPLPSASQHDGAVVFLDNGVDPVGPRFSDGTNWLSISFATGGSITGDYTFQSGAAIVADGDVVSTPAARADLPFQFRGDTDTGIGRLGANVFGLFANAEEIARVDAGGVTLATGKTLTVPLTTAAPSLSGAGQAGTGIGIANDAGVRRVDLWTDGTVSASLAGTRFIIGANVSQSTGLIGGTASAPNLQVQGATSGAAMQSITMYAASGQGGALVLGRSRSATLGGMSALQSGDALGILAFGGTSNTVFRRGATITATADGTFTDASAATRIEILTTPSGSLTAQAAARFGADGRVFFPRMGSVATLPSANVFIQASGGDAPNELIRVTSSQRWKTDIETVKIDIARDILRGVRSVWYRGRGTLDRSDWGAYGFIAEEVDRVSRHLTAYEHPRLPDEVEAVVVDYEPGTPTGLVDAAGQPILMRGAPITEQRAKQRWDMTRLEPSGVHYDRFPAIHHAILRDHDPRIEALESTVAALTAAVAALEARLAALESRSQS